MKLIFLRVDLASVDNKYYLCGKNYAIYVN